MFNLKRKKDLEIEVIGEHENIPIYRIFEKGKISYEHGINPIESFDTLDKTLCDINNLLHKKYGRWDI